MLWSTGCEAGVSSGMVPLPHVGSDLHCPKFCMATAITPQLSPWLFLWSHLTDSWCFAVILTSTHNSSFRYQELLSGAHIDLNNWRKTRAVLSFSGASSFGEQIFYNYPHMSVANNFHTHLGLVKVPPLWFWFISLSSKAVTVQCAVGTAIVVFLNRCQCF